MNLTGKNKPKKQVCHEKYTKSQSQRHALYKSIQEHIVQMDNASSQYSFEQKILINFEIHNVNLKYVPFRNHVPVEELE